MANEERTSEFSLTQRGNYKVIAGFLVILAQSLGVDIPEGEVVQLLSGITVAIGVIQSWYGRYRIGDINILGQRNS